MSPHLTPDDSQRRPYARCYHGHHLHLHLGTDWTPLKKAPQLKSYPCAHWPLLHLPQPLGVLAALESFACFHSGRLAVAFLHRYQLGLAQTQYR